MRVLLPVLATGALAAAVAGCASSSAKTHPSTTGAQNAAAAASQLPPDEGGTAAASVPSTLPESRRRGGADYQFSITHGARVHRDPKTHSFYVTSATPPRPGALFVSVHGHNGTAWQEYRRWQPYTAEHGLGLVSVEWQTQWGGNAQFLSTAAVYGIIQRAVKAEGTAPGRVLLHGFSMGSHQTYGLTTLDRLRSKLFALTIAESGGEHGPLGQNPALKGTRWVLYCAGKDPWPDLSGCPAMRRAQSYLQSNGASVVRFIVDPPHGHGGMNRDRRDVELAIGDFTRALAGR